MIKTAILGSTGSIGRSALSLVDLYPERFEVVALAAGRNQDLLLDQCRKYRPRLAVLSDDTAARELARLLPEVRVLSGEGGMIEAACHPDVDTVLSAIMGAAGLVPTYHAIRQGKKVALANKETLVTAGALLIPMLDRFGASLVPVDSEHSALHQCLRGSRTAEVSRLILTASGGPFRTTSAADLERVTVEAALNHPTWNMGAKITVDSATLMNKGLEVIEAHHLFQVATSRISVILHPQSVLHSIVEFVDGTMLAQLSITDMRSSLLYAFGYPQRWESRLPRLDLLELSPLTFGEPDTQRFPCLRLAYEALESGGTYPTVLNAANEIAVEAFLAGRVRFLDIPRIIEAILQDHQSTPVTDLETVLEADAWARGQARRAC